MKKLFYTYIQISIGILLVGIVLSVPFFTVTAQINFSFEKNLFPTDQAEDVSQLQEILKTEGLYCLGCNVTGYFGYWTQAGLMNLQERYDLQITGIVDEETRVKLNELYVSSDSFSFGGSLAQGESASTEEQTEQSGSGLEEDSVLPDSGETEGLVIVLVGEANITVEQNTTYIDEGAKATDDVDGDITEKIVTDNPVNTTVLGTYKVTYNVSNEAGDTTNITRTVEIVSKVVVGGGGSSSPPPPPPPSSGSADITAPSAITDLVASNPTSSSIVLSWTTSGDDGNIGTATSYDVRYATSNIVDIDWDSATQVISEPTPQIAGSSESFTLSGLSIDTYYYFAIRVVDEASNSSTNSNTAELRTDIADDASPATVVDLATSNPTTSSVDLSWTATGDNGSEGTATSYDIRYSTSWITQENWDSATQASDEPAPQVSGSSETFTLSELAAGATYYFMIKVLDEVANESGFSNVVNAQTLSPSEEEEVVCETVAAGNQTYFVTTTSSPRILEVSLALDLPVGVPQVVTVKAEDPSPITAVSVTIQTDNESNILSLSLISGTGENGTWQESRTVTDTHCTTYVIIVTATNASGQSSVNLSIF